MSQRIFIISAFTLRILCVSAVKGEIIDRTAVTVDASLITQSRLLEEMRVTAFLNGAPADLSAQSRRVSAERMVDQLLMRREMDLTRFPQPTLDDVAGILNQLKARDGGEAGFQGALQRAGITERQVTDALLRQAALLQFIDLRFKPEVQVQEPELLQYYENVCLPEAQKKKQPPPSREQCDETLTAQKVDQRVEAWLKEARGRARIQFEEGAFQ